MPSVRQSNVAFVRYMAENLSALDYKTQEEVLTVIKHTTTVLSVVGMQISAIWHAQGTVRVPIVNPSTACLASSDVTCSDHN